MYRIGVDVGGTFTDFVMLNSGDGTVVYFKHPSTPHDPSEAIAAGLSQMLEISKVDPSEIEFLGHGTTVATNMIIEREGVPTALLTTKGFRDVLAIGRQTRPGLYDYRIRKPDPLVPRYRRIEVNERLAADGSVLQALDESEIGRAASDLWADGVKSIAICFLHAYRNPEHEEAALRVVERLLPDAYVSISSQVLPEFREYERTSTTVLNAYIGPKMRNYIRSLRQRLDEVKIPVRPLTIHSNGGLLSLETVERLPVLTCLSGPAAGVVGAAALGTAAGFLDLITFDVGGTSTDVSLIAGGEPQFTSKREIAQYPLKMPMIDIQVIGAGGGSIAWVDDAGALKVGPRSAGAVPGPVAYGKGGTEPTLTDAQICLQRLNPVSLLNGRMPINRDRAWEAIETKIAQPLGMSVEQAAHGMIRVAAANMSRAIRSISIEHGHDLADFTLVSFGGAGPLHSSEVARECGIGRILVPQEPGTMCARGILLSDISLDFVRTELMLASTDTWPRLRHLFEEMVGDGNDWLEQERVPTSERGFLCIVEARYRGQNHEIRIPLPDDSDDALDVFLAAFHAKHKEEYGSAILTRAVEIVNCRVRASGRVARAALAPHKGGYSTSHARTGERKMYCGQEEGWQTAGIYLRPALPVGSTVSGPAIIEEMSSTTIVLPGQTASVDSFGNLLIEG